VFPIKFKDRLLYLDRKDVLRIKGKPLQKNPLEKSGGIICVLGAGNYSSAFEIILVLLCPRKKTGLNLKSNTTLDYLLLSVKSMEEQSVVDRRL
jgi:hypothetical protein